MGENSDKVTVVIPAFNEERVILSVLKEIKEAGYETVIVVDDGSVDKTYQKGKEAGAIVLRHAINRGKGAAAKTGVEAAKTLSSKIIVTMDGDGQHNPKDIDKMVELIDGGQDVVLGSRLKTLKGMPRIKVIYNILGNFFTWLIYGLWVTDSQSGFRAYSEKAASLIDTKTDRYEYDSEIIREIRRNKLKYIEIPIEVRYSEYSMNKKQKQGFVNGVKTLVKMIISS